MGFFKKLFGSSDTAGNPSASDTGHKKAFSMRIDAVSVIPGRGTVITGTVASGVIRVGDNVQVYAGVGDPLQSVVTGIEKSRKLLDRAVSGETVDCLLWGIQPEDVKAGQTLLHRA